MAAQAMGPTYAGGTQPIVKDGYAVLYLPDVNNAELIAAGDAPVFYSVPNTVRMARKDGPDTGDYLFNLVRFAGTGGDGTIGASSEVAGGVLSFSVTGAIPEGVRRQAEEDIIARYDDSDDVFWGLNGRRQRPMFRPAVIASNTTTVSNVSPTPRGLPVHLPAARDRARSGYSFYGIPGQREGARPLPGTTPARDRRGSGITLPRDADVPAVLTEGSDSNLDPWYWQMHGNGSGSIDPSGTHAFSGLIGAYPTAICWEAFHGTASPLIVIQNYKLKVWSPVVRLTIRGEWDSVFQHFSAAASGRYLWASVDIQTEFNNMRINGDITVDMKVDTTLPGADEIARRLDERSNLVFEKFMEEAKKRIFEPPQPDVEAAEASSSGGSIFSPWGAGLSLKYRRDETQLKLTYDETQQFAYLQDHTISNSLAGMYDEIRSDPDAEKKYFLTVYLDDWPSKLARVVRPVAAWNDGAVEFLSVQVGYPTTTGAIRWEGHSFTEAGGDDGSWKYQTALKAAEDVQNPPEGWTSDLTFVKRKVHLAEPPSELIDPYRRVQIERNVIDLDPEPNGQLLNDTTLEVRADSAGRLAVGPIELGAVLTDETQKVEAVFEPVDPDTGDPLGMPAARFSWSFDDDEIDRMWTIFSGDPDLRPFFRYRVFVTIKGTLFEPGRSWEGDWVQANGNGPLIVSVPPPSEARGGPRYAADDRIRLLRESAPRDTEPSRTGDARTTDDGGATRPQYLEYSV